MLTLIRFKTGRREAMKNNTQISDALLDQILAQTKEIKHAPSIFVHEVFIDATNPDKRPFWELDERFLNPFAEVEDIMTWCKIGDRPALEKSGITTISSVPKQGKSASMYALLMHLISGKPFGNMTPVGEPPRMAIIFDTEMSKNDLIRRYRLIIKTIGEKDAMRLRIVPLKSYPKTERMEIIRDMCDRYNPEIVVFDTISRLVSNFNDAQENIEFGELILPLSEGRTIIALNHLTFQTEKQKGHLGSIMEELAVENYGVKKESGVINLTIKNARNSDTEDPTPFQFLLTQEGGMIDATAKMAELEAQKVSQWNANFNLLWADVDAEEMSNKDLVKLIMEREGLGERDAQTKIANGYKLGVLKKERRGQCVMYSLTKPIP